MEQKILYAFAVVYAVIGAGYVYALLIDSRSLMNIMFGLLMAFTGVVLYTVPRLERRIND
jgi:uncharacterized membrane protein YfcA